MMLSNISYGTCTIIPLNLQEALCAGTIDLATKKEQTPLTFLEKEECVKESIEESKGPSVTINYQEVRNNRGIKKGPFHMEHQRQSKQRTLDWGQ